MEGMSTNQLYTWLP